MGLPAVPRPQSKRTPREMRSSPAASAVSAAFDEPNLIAYGGLVPVMRLAERCGLSRLVAAKVKLTGVKNGASCVNPARGGCAAPHPRPGRGHSAQRPRWHRSVCADSAACLARRSTVARATRRTPLRWCRERDSDEHDEQESINVMVFARARAETTRRLGQGHSDSEFFSGEVAEGRPARCRADG